MAEKEKLEVAEGFVYNPTLENKGLPIVGNLTSPPPPCSNNSFYLRINNSYELSWGWRTYTSNVMPEKEKMEVADRIVYAPTRENDCLLIVGNLRSLRPPV